MAEKKVLMNSSEAAQYLGVARRTLYNLVYFRKVPFTKAFGKLQFDLELLNSFLMERTFMPPKPKPRPGQSL